MKKKLLSTVRMLNSNIKYGAMQHCADAGGGRLDRKSSTYPASDDHSTTLE